MEQIAGQIAQKRISEALPEIRRAAYQDAMKELLAALEFDIDTVVKIGFANGETIWRDSKAQKAVAAAFMREVRKQLTGRTF